MSKKAFVIGHPIAHSRSPLIHGAWLEAYNIEGSYEAIDVAPADLSTHFERLRAGEFVGGNITIPHKEQVIALCDSLDPLAQAIGAVNTVTVENGVIHASNTDYLGFLGNLDQTVPDWDADLDTALVLGAGGAARAILVALASRKVRNIHLLNRTRETAISLAAEMSGRFAGSFKGHGLDAFSTLAPAAGLVVNTSAIGMHNSRFETLDLTRLPKTALVTDIVYTPLMTPLLVDASHLGLRTVDGLGMLLHQAVPGFEAWFGLRPAVTVQLRQAIEATLDPN